VSAETRVLVVDDHAGMAKTVAEILRHSGYVTEIAHSGSEALDKLAEGHFDCLLSDIKMPRMNGIELYRTVKAQQPNLPTVLMTAYSTDALVQQGIAEGVRAVLRKPLDIPKLLALVASVSCRRLAGVSCP